MSSTKCGISACTHVSRSAPNTPTSTPRKRNQATGHISSSPSIDVSHLHTFYKTILARSDDGALTPVSRSEFNDLLNMLETVGLLILSSASSPSTPTKSGRRTASFGAIGKGGGREVSFVEGVRMDEILRGLGLQDDGMSTVVDIKEEEIRSLWEKEKVRIARESKTRHGEEALSKAFEDAAED
ncbi:hypothetical protein NM688_g2175 [Phlebia brevispora]|uniref:Uncharacterized protein n=1 Tax=Phlebia brevispora TaxID=194682 RepID=A0ACC1T999_9APHY|nr:hypothetical protein NM688_g2175 [Phlebia brevispora]